jgi:hypothetical protein
MNGPELTRSVRWAGPVDQAVQLRVGRRVVFYALHNTRAPTGLWVSLQSPRKGHFEVYVHGLPAGPRGVPRPAGTFLVMTLTWRIIKAAHRVPGRGGCVCSANLNPREGEQHSPPSSSAPRRRACYCLS